MTALLTCLQDQVMATMESVPIFVIRVTPSRCDTWQLNNRIWKDALVAVFHIIFAARRSYLLHPPFTRSPREFKMQGRSPLALRQNQLEKNLILKLLVGLGGGIKIKKN